MDSPQATEDFRTLNSSKSTQFTLAAPSFAHPPSHPKEKPSFASFASTPAPPKEIVLSESQPSTPQHQIDGGVHAWLTVFGGWLVLISSFGYTNAFGVFQDYYTRQPNTSLSASQISWIGSTQLFFVIAMGFPAGRLVDQGYFRWCVVFGSLLYVFS